MFGLIDLIIYMAISMLSGAVFGLIPFFVGRCMNKPNLGQLGWKWSMVAGLLFLQVPVAVGFVVAIIVRQNDYYPQPGSFVSLGGGYQQTAPAQSYSSGGSLAVSCISGPLKGRVYRISDKGLTIGRDNSCTISFGANAGGISRQHCYISYRNGELILTDMNSTYGTYLSDGTRLPPQYPTRISAGSRFYLGSTENLFGIVIQA